MNESQNLIATLNDPVAKRTRWGPASGGGASFQEHKLVEATPRRLEYRMVLGAKLLHGLFIAIGAGFFLAAFYSLLHGSAIGALGGCLMGLIPGGVGTFFYVLSARPRVFDLDDGWFWKGRRPPSAGDVDRRNECVAINETHALQIVRETVRTRDGTKVDTFYSYELNLVLNDGSRINVVDHGNIDAIRSDAARLSEFLGIPVWDATLTLPTYECSASAKGCALLLGTVVGGMVLFVIGAELLLALGMYLDRQIGNGFFWIALLLLAICVSVLIVGRMIRRERRSRRESHAQNHNEDAFSPGWTYTDSPLHDNTAREHSVRSPHAKAAPQLPNTNNCDEQNANSLPADIPYDVDKRPMPDGEDLEQLLPERVGSFQRGRIRAGPDLYRDPIYVEYTAGQHAVEMELGICRSPEDAQQGVRTSIAESADVRVATEAVSVGTDPSFHKGEFDNPRMGESGKGVGIAWSRGRYYFSAGARTRDVLNKFMTAFPY